MLPEFGHFTIILAFCLSLLQVALPLWGAKTGRVVLMQSAQSLAWGQCFFLTISMIVLAYAFVANDFSIAYVAQNSNSRLPIFYRLCAIWGAHEGSLLLWVFILSVWMAVVSFCSRSLPRVMLARVLAVMSMISVGFYLFLLTTSNPFQRLLPHIPLDGRDLNPILQDPGLVSHPPMLYLGYVGFSVPFAFAMAALMGGRMDAMWARWARPWTLVAWSFLTAGIVLGSWWAYRELGWGGWWFWDPVENASFMPWLMGTALIHSLIVTDKRHLFQNWTVLLAVCAFSLSLLGTFLVRSGVLISVHSFAVDPKRGLFMLCFLMLVIGSALLLYAWRGRQITRREHFSFWSRETMLLMNNVLLLVGMSTVLLGTLYPLIMDALHLGKLSVGAPYFNTIFVPLMVPLLLFMGMGPKFHWEKMELKWFKFRLVCLFALVVLVAICLPWLVGGSPTLSVVLGLALAFWVIANSMHIGWKLLLQRWKNLMRISCSQIGMLLAHVGMAVVVVGIVLTTTYSESRHLSMKIGDKVSVGRYQFQFKELTSFQGPNYSGTDATVVVKRDHRELTRLHPQRRQFLVQRTILSKTAIDMGVFRDLYVALGASLGDGAWAMRIYYKPFIRWIWVGGLMIALGGFIAVWNRRFRKKKKRRNYSANR